MDFDTAGAPPANLRHFVSVVRGATLAPASVGRAFLAIQSLRKGVLMTCRIDRLVSEGSVVVIG